MLKPLANISDRVDWQSELSRIATRHHVIVCWVAIILNPIWFVADYFTIPLYWKTFFVVRIAVTALTLLAVLLYKKINISTELLILIPFLGISLQNAYMWSVMDVPMLQKHAFAYIALFIGAGMLVLWKPTWTIGVVGLSLIANIFFLRTNSLLSTQEILINGGMLVVTVAVISVVLIHARYVLTKKEIIARLALAEINKELEIKNNIIEEKNKDITASISYAKRIQEAMLPEMDLKYRLFPNAFIYYQPRDIVSGDFYWFAEKGNKKIIAAVDCTGHGVPGAFMSMIGNAMLNEIVLEKGIIRASDILNHLREDIIKSLKQTGAQGEQKDGMDISLCVFDKNDSKLEFSGANNPLWIVAHENPSTLKEIKGDKQPIGIYTGNPTPFTHHEVQLSKGDCIYIFTDGFADQMGGETGKKFKSKTMKEFLLTIQHIPMREQETVISKLFADLKGTCDQTDDILVIGIAV